MKNPKKIFFLVIAALLYLNVYSQDYVTQTKETLAKITPQSALQMLKDGNERFMSGKNINRDYMSQVKATSKNQYPFAIILNCIDSRSPSEILFDQGIGDVFNARIAGNIVDEDILGSMEFACKVMGAKLIVVMGHTNCGAIKGACDDVKMGNLTDLLAKIKPAVDSVKETGDRSSKNYGFVSKVTEENVRLALQNIKANSPILKEMLDKGEIILVGAMYDLETGQVTFYE
jgi:carbonic anhydrase